MTASQLTHLAEMAAYAAGFFVVTDPAAAALFEDAALRADTLSVELRHEEDFERQGTNLDVNEPAFLHEVTL
jgi:hypothetical protein